MKTIRAFQVPRVTRFDVRSQQLEFSITDTQLPMFLRIVNLALALQNGDLERLKRSAQAAAQETGDTNDPDDPGGGGGGQATASHDDGECEEGGGESWSGWAWNMGSSVGNVLLPIYWEDEDGSEAGGSGDVIMAIKKDRVVHFGFYIDSASLVLKLTEKQKEKNLFGSTKLCFTPFAKIDVTGFVQDIISKGRHFIFKILKKSPSNLRQNGLFFG